MAFEGLVQWAHDVVAQAKNVAAAVEALRQLTMHFGQTLEPRRAVHALHATCHHFVTAVHKLLEHRDWAVEHGLCAGVDFSEIDQFSKDDIRDLRNMREHQIDYFRGTGSLFLPLEGENSFSSLDNAPRIKAFFEKTFPDIAPMVPDVAGDFLNHPVGHMSTVKCSPWHHDDQCLLIGDAAHGLIPFFGQGMNSGFEDCRILNDFLDLYHDDWSRVMPAFYLARKPNTDAASEMSTDNHHEIQMGIRNQRFNFKKQLEQQLMQRYPDRYVSKHVLVMFSNTPYATALAHGRLQSTLLDQICNQTTQLSDVDWLRVDELMHEYDNALAHTHDQTETA